MPSRHNKRMQMDKMEVDQELMGYLAKEEYNTGQMASRLTNHGGQPRRPNQRTNKT